MIFLCCISSLESGLFKLIILLLTIQNLNARILKIGVKNYLKIAFCQNSNSNLDLCKKSIKKLSEALKKK